MRYWEILVFCLGISLDVFGAAVCPVSYTHLTLPTTILV